MATVIRWTPYSRATSSLSCRRRARRRISMRFASRFRCKRACRARLARAQVVEGTVERIDYDRGVFDLRPRDSGRIVTIALPYNARGADVDNFRRLRNGDYVRVEGEFVNGDNVQLMAFLR